MSIRWDIVEKTNITHHIFTNDCVQLQISFFLNFGLYVNIPDPNVFFWINRSKRNINNNWTLKNNKSETLIIPKVKFFSEFDWSDRRVGEKLFGYSLANKNTPYIETRSDRINPVINLYLNPTRKQLFLLQRFFRLQILKASQKRDY